MTPDTQNETEPVATGDRRDDVHFEPDPDQLVRIRATFKPDDPQGEGPSTRRSEDDAVGSSPPVEDVRVAPAGASVWDARPADASDDSHPRDGSEPD